MSIDYNTLEVSVDLSAIRHNYRVLAERGSRVYAVVKADAYGHGMIQIVRALEEEGADTFAVGAVKEGVKLRDSGCESRIVSMLGPLNEADCRAVVENDLIAVVGGFEQFDLLSEFCRAHHAEAQVCLKFDTGMGRLGFSKEDLPRLINRLGKAAFLDTVMVCSHLAAADEPGYSDYVDAQADRFRSVVGTLREAGYAPEASIANSAGLLGHDDLFFNAQRAGIALYGSNPLHGTPWDVRGGRLKPAMEVSAEVVAVHPLKTGQSISYGCTYTAMKDMTVAIVAAGYADGYSRLLSNKGFMCIRGRRARIVGRVCMQLTAVDVSDIPEVSFGDRAFLLGGEGESTVTPEELAGWWGTITYEIFCLLGMNRRTYKQQQAPPGRNTMQEEPQNVLESS